VPTEAHGDQYLYLTTRGRKSGQPREIEIWFTQRAACYYVIAEYSTSHWIQNIRSNPNVEVRVGSATFAGTARIVSQETEQDLFREVQERSRQKYGWGNGLVVELMPR
jgi:deazaflavin-dependent oxidoreductase (nitroreductase family)